MKIGRQIIMIIYLKALKNNQRRKLGNVPFQEKKRQQKVLNFSSFTLYFSFLLLTEGG